MSGRLLAQCVRVSGQEICGPAKQFNGSYINTPGDIINQVMPFLYGVAAVILLFVFIWGGFDLVLSRGDPAKIKSSRAKITSGIVGVILLSLAYLITRLVSQMFNLGEGLF